MHTQSAAFAIWAAAAPLALLAVLAGRNLAANILVGAPDAWPTVLAITVTAPGRGAERDLVRPADGRKRVAQSLLAQAAGLVAGAGVAAWRIMAHDAAGAALAFAGGSLVTSCVALPFALRLGLRSFRSAGAGRRSGRSCAIRRPSPPPRATPQSWRSAFAGSIASISA